MTQATAGARGAPLAMRVVEALATALALFCAAFALGAHLGLSGCAVESRLDALAGFPVSRHGPSFPCFPEKIHSFVNKAI